MESDFEISPLTRLLALNTEIAELEVYLMRQPLASRRIAEFQDHIDFRRRTSLATCWLVGDYDLEEEDVEDEDNHNW